ncbi:MAG: hypothetical protein H7174_07960, partial [Flavobacterium sp.]|nr:hypothetical protein [Flavobacterium sp.]
IKADTAAKAKLESEKAKADADKLIKDQVAAEAKIKADAAAKAKLESDKAKSDADKIVKDKLSADAKAKADADKLIKDQAVAETKIKAAAAAKAKLESDKAKADADKILKDKLAADAKVKLESDKAKADADKLIKDQAAAETKIKADAAAKAKLESDKAKADTDKILKDKLAADVKAKADKLIKDQAASEAKIKADAAAKAKLESDKSKADADKILKEKLATAAKAKADADKIVKDKLATTAKATAEADKTIKDQVAAEAKIKTDAAAKSKADADKASADAKAKTDTPKNDDEKSMDYIFKILDDNGKNSKQLLSKLDSTLVSKTKDLKELKEENDLGDKGVFKDPKPFKSVSAANKILETIKTDLTDSNNTQNQFLIQLEELVIERQKKYPSKTDPITLKYQAAIDKIKAEQIKNELSRTTILTKLEQLKTEFDIEKKRRIKRAAFENGQGRYEQDRAALKRIKETTTPAKVALTPADFDFGSDDQSNMQILKRIENTQNGYYLILAVHNDVLKRDAFIAKVVSTGQQNIDFFYDVSTSKYFIYTRKYDGLEEISNALDLKGTKAYNGKMFVVKVEN